MKRLSIALVLAFAVLPASLFAEPIEGLHAGDMTRIRDAFKGRPSVLHVWSLTCAPCIAELPKWAARIKHNPDVAFVFINTDGLRYAPSLATRLSQAGVQPTRSLVYADDFVERLQYEISSEWHGELPRNELVNRSGDVLITVGSLSDTEFEKWNRQRKR